MGQIMKLHHSGVAVASCPHRPSAESGRVGGRRYYYSKEAGEVYEEAGLEDGATVRGRLAVRYRRGITLEKGPLLYGTDMI